MSQSEKYSDSASVSRGNPFEPFYNLILSTQILFFRYGIKSIHSITHWLSSERLSVYRRDNLIG